MPNIPNIQDIPNIPDIHLAAVNKKIIATLNLPGSKSIANRVLPLAAIASGVSIIHNVPDIAEDVVLMLDALKTLGIKVSKIVDLESLCPYPTYKVEGCAGNFPINQATIFCGNSGTTIRFLTAILAFCKGTYCLTGIKRMLMRPIKDLVDGLSQVGVNISYIEHKGYPPVQIDSFIDNGVSSVHLSGQVSSQYLTGILMALPLLQRDMQVAIYDNLISKPYVDITLALLAKFGAVVMETTLKHNSVSANDNASTDTSNNNANANYLVQKINSLNAIDYSIEPDASSASYFLAMGAINGDITVNNLSRNSLQGDRNFAKILHQMGAKVSYLDNAIQVARGEHLMAVDVNMQDMPDVAMTVAVVALFAQGGTTTIRGIASWKIKETDRLQAMYNELSKVGATVAITADSISITPPLVIKENVAIDTYNDHRMAMCFSLLAVGGIPVIINNYKCVGKTFANYFDLFKQITQ